MFQILKMMSQLAYPQPNYPMQYSSSCQLNQSTWTDITNSSESYFCCIHKSNISNKEQNVFNIEEADTKHSNTWTGINSNNQHWPSKYDFNYDPFYSQTCGTSNQFCDEFDFSIESLILPCDQKDQGPETHKDILDELQDPADTESLSNAEKCRKYRDNK